MIRFRIVPPRSTFVAAVIALGLVSPLVHATTASAAGETVSISADASIVNPGARVSLTSGMPVSGAGTVSQEIVQTIDPTRVVLTGINDISYPQGWTLSYCSGIGTDCSIAANFTTTTPASAGAWAVVKAVKASGLLVSEGSESGRQIAKSTASGTGVKTAPATLNVSAGVDGFQVFFDADRTRAFNIYHHNSASLDCWVVASGSRCPGFPFAWGFPSTPPNSAEQAIGRVIGSNIWIQGIGAFGAGYLFCVDISAVLSGTGGPVNCPGLYQGALVVNAGVEFTNFAGATPLGSKDETKIYAVDSKSNPVTAYCIDTATKTKCGQFATSIVGSSFAYDFGNSVLWGDRLYISHNSRTITCVLVTGAGYCPGWTTQPNYSVSANVVGKLFELPSAAGGIRRVCYLPVGLDLTTTSASYPCWDESGARTFASAYNFPSFRTYGAINYYGVPVRKGTRLFFGNGDYNGSGEILCYDALANGGTGGRCNGDSTNLGYLNYTVTPDPLIDNCMWITQHNSPVIQAMNILNRTTGCTSIAPTKVTFSGTTIVPRMACSSTSAINSWKSFTLTSVTGTFTSASLSVMDSTGTPVSGWQDVPLTVGAELNLASLPSATTGQKPSFVVNFGGVTGNLSAGAQVKAVGDAPQLCLTVTALTLCPTGTGPVPALTGSSFTASGSGSSTDSSSTTTLLNPASTTVTVSAPTSSQCGSTLTGTATVTGGSTPVAGATVTLLDSSGNPVLVNGQPVTTTTATNGTYSFGYLLPGDYKVKFGNTTVATATQATTISGSSGTVTGSTASYTCPGGGTTASISGASSAISAVAGATFLDRSTNLVTNGDFTERPAPSSMVQTGARTTAKTGQTADSTYFWAPNVVSPQGYASGQTAAPWGAVTGWTASGGGEGTYAQWATTNEYFNSTAITTKWNHTGALLNGASNAAVYFGNWSTWSGQPSPLTFDANGYMTGTFSFTNSNTTNWGDGNGVSLSQNIATTAGTRYRLQWWVGSEVWGSTNGLAAINIGSLGRVYFKVPVSPVRYTLEFVAPTSSTNISFTSWGHFTNTYELVLDDVIAQGCTYLPDMVSNQVSVAVGTGGVVNGTYSLVAGATADTSIGAQGAPQTINVVGNDTASTGANLTSPTITFCTTTVPATGCTLTSKVVPGEGTYTISNGSVVFTPCTGINTPAGASCTGAFTGQATPIAYQVTDSAGSSATATVTPTVVASPTAQPDTSTGIYNTAQTANLLSNDSSGSGATLSASSIRLCNPTTTPAQTPNNCTVAAGSTITVPNVGTYSVNSSGVVTFTPSVNYFGTPPALAYQVQDSLGQYTSSTYTPTVQPPPAPTAAADTTKGLTGATQTVTPFSNDTVGATGVTFTASSVKLCATGQTVPGCNATSLVVPGQGTYSVNTTTGVITFTPCSAANTPAGASCTGAFTGPATPVAYQVSTNTGQVATSTYTPTVVPPPTAVADTATGNWDVNQTFSPTSNDSAATGTTLVAVPLGICTNGTAAASCTGTTLTVANQGTYTLNTTTGVVTFDPLPSFTGTATPIQYVVADALGQKSTSTITPTVTPPPAPAATPQSKTVLPGASVSFTTLTGTGGLATTGGPAFTTSATCLVNTSVTPNTCGTTLTIAGEGSYSLNTTTGVVTFTAVAGATAGTKTPVTYRVTDATGQTATSTITPIIPPPPALANDTSVNEQNAVQTISVLANDSASAYTTLNASSVKLCPTNATAPFTATNCNLTTLSVTNQGTYMVNADGTVSFTPCVTAAAAVCPASTKYSGVADTVRYIAQDNLGQYGTATITPTVLPPPVARASNDAGSAAFAHPVVFDPLANDSGGTTTGLVGYTSTGTATLDPASVRLCTAGQSSPNCTGTSLTTSDGTYTVDTTTGAITFTPATNFTGTPSNPPSYMVCNVIGGTWAPMAPPASCATARVVPTIAAPVAPVAVNDTSTGAYDTKQTINVLGNDTKDPALTLLVGTVRLCGAGQTPPNCTLTTLTVPGEGTYTVNADGTVTFDPLPTFTGTVASPPTYQVSDSFGNKVSATITPTVTPPLAPVATPDQRLVVPGGTVEFTVLIGSGSLSSGTQIQSGNVAGPCLVDPSDSTCKDTFTIAGEGTWTVDRLTGLASFAADALATPGNKTPVTYRVRDITGQVASSTLTPIVPAPPTAVNDTSIDGLDRNQTIDILGNDTTGIGTTVVVPSVRLCGVLGSQTAPNCTQTSVTVPGEGTWTVNADGTVTFDPEPTFVGVASTIGYQVADSLGQVASATITATVTSTPPVANPDTVTLYPGGTKAFRSIFGSSALAAPAAGGPALVNSSACLVDPVTRTCGSTVTIAGEGTYILDAGTGVVTYTAVSNATIGAKTPVTYRIRDAVGATASSTLTPTIVAAPSQSQSQGSGAVDKTSESTTPSKSAPVAVDQHGWTAPLKPLYFNPFVPSTPSKNARFVDSGMRILDPSTGKWVTEAVTPKGTWIVLGHNVRFTPAAGFIGIAQVRYRLVDTTGKSAAALLTVRVTEHPMELPRTGSDPATPLMAALGLVLTGLFLTVRRRRLVR